MLTQTVTITQNSNPNIIIGRRSTYETQQVIFDVSWLIQTYGEGTATLLIKRPKDASAYPVVAVLDGNTLTWTVSETDTQDKGHGECEIYWYVDGGLAKSCICGITILRDIGDTTETAPDPYETWVDELARLGSETLANAQAAQQSANNAAQSATEAGNSAAAALESEENALNSENAAKASEQAAAASAQGAEQSATEARQSATEAAQSATNAHDDATDASASADRAEQAAASIEGDTERAEAAARTAQGAATSAQGSASTASTKATEASQSAATAGQAASTATQKAADASTAATAAAGSASSASASATAAGNAQTAAETAQGKAEDAQEAAETAAQSIEDSAAQIDENTAGLVELRSALNTKAGILRDTASGSVASFVPDATVPNLLGLDVALEPIQDLHGYDSPWPGGGGKNLFNPAEAVDGVYISNDTGEERGQTGSTATGFIPVTAGLFYRMSPTLNSGNWGAFYDANKVFISGFSGYSGAKTAPTGAAYLRCTINRDNNNPDWATNFQVEQNTEATAYAPYSNICPISGWDSVDIWNKPTHDTTLPPTVTIQLGQTVYGGTLDVTNGTLTVDRVSVDMGTLDWRRHNFSGTFCFYVQLPNMKAEYPYGLCESYEVVTSRSPARLENGEMILDNGVHVRYIYLRDDAFSDVAEFKAAVSGVQLVYELDNPTPISTTPTEISTVDGQNNVFSPDGDVTVEYAADLKTYIDQKIAAAVAAMS